MLKVDEKYTIINYIFSGTIFWALMIPWYREVGSFCNWDFTCSSIFENSFLDGMLAVVVFFMTGMILAYFKDTFFKVKFRDIDKNRFEDSGIEELEQLKQKCSSGFDFAHKGYFLMLRSGYNIMFLINMLLYVNSLGTIKMALLIPAIMYLITSFSMANCDFALYSMILILVIILLMKVKDRFLAAYESNFVFAIESYFKYGFHKK